MPFWGGAGACGRLVIIRSLLKMKISSPRCLSRTSCTSQAHGFPRQRSQHWGGEGCQGAAKLVEGRGGRSRMVRAGLLDFCSRADGNRWRTLFSFGLGGSGVRSGEKQKKNTR